MTTNLNNPSEPQTYLDWEAKLLEHVYENPSKLKTLEDEKNLTILARLANSPYQEVAQAAVHFIAVNCKTKAARMILHSVALNPNRKIYASALADALGCLASGGDSDAKKYLSILAGRIDPTTMSDNAYDSINQEIRDLLRNI